MVLHCGFDLHFSDKEWCQASFHVFVSHLYVFSGELTDTFIRPLPVEKMATHSSILAWRIPWIEGPGVLQSMGLHRVGHDWSDLACSTHACLQEIVGGWLWDGADADTFSHGSPSISGDSLTDPSTELLYHGLGPSFGWASPPDPESLPQPW